MWWAPASGPSSSWRRCGGARNTAFAFGPLRALGTAHALLGEFADLAAVLDRAARNSGGTPDEYVELARYWLVEAQGDLEDARAQAGVARDVSTRLKTWEQVWQETVLLAGLEQRLGNRERAEEFYQEALRQADTFVLTRVARVSTSTLLALEAAARGDAEVMARCRETLAPYEGIIGGPFVTHALAIGRVLGVMAGAEGKWDEAVGYLERAVQFCEEKGLVVELAHSRLALADTLLHRSPRRVYDNSATGQPVVPAAGDEGGHPSTRLRTRAGPPLQGVPRPEDRPRAMALLD